MTSGYIQDFVSVLTSFSKIFTLLLFTGRSLTVYIMYVGESARDQARVDGPYFSFVSQPLCLPRRFRMKSSFVAVFVIILDYVYTMLYLDKISDNMYLK